MLRAMRRYSYVGPASIRDELAGAEPGTPITCSRDLERFADGEPLTFVVDAKSVLRVAPRRSEHVACAGGGEVLTAGELTAVRGRSGGCRIVEISNQSAGYCPEPESWGAVADALDRAQIPHPGRFTFEAVFRRCPGCGERNLVKDGDFVCALCEAPLPSRWNF